MKLIKVLSSLAILGVSLSGMAFASTTGTYFPPERIHCMKTESGKLRCEGFSHQYLTEDLHTAHMDKQDDTFSFVSGAAYFTPDMSEASVFFTYKNAEQRVVKLKTTSILLHPELKDSGWKKVVDDVYVCEAGYMHCPITDKVAS